MKVRLKPDGTGVFLGYGWFYRADIVKIYGMGSVIFLDGCARDKYKVQECETL